MDLKNALGLEFRKILCARLSPIRNLCAKFQVSRPSGLRFALVPRSVYYLLCIYTIRINKQIYWRNPLENSAHVRTVQETGRDSRHPKKLAGLDPFAAAKI